ncbi:MAG: hypothetical protein ACI9EF_003163, partial [Pseudohongiellaceae bacterium]
MVAVSRLVRSLFWQIVAVVLGGMGLAGVFERLLAGQLEPQVARWSGILIATMVASALFYRLVVLRIARLNV